MKRKIRKFLFYLKITGLSLYVLAIIVKDFLWQKRKSIIIGLLIFLILTFLGCWRIAPIKSNPQTATPTVTKLSNFQLEIPKLNISVPVTADVDGNNKDVYFKALESGVAHFQGTAKPGEGSNVFIFGHSSFYADEPGNFKEIFKNLDGLEKGDEIIVFYSQKEYHYTVSTVKTVRPDELEVLKATPTEQLTLMTCWPPGTTRERLIVISKLQS